MKLTLTPDQQQLVTLTREVLVKLESITAKMPYHEKSAIKATLWQLHALSDKPGMVIPDEAFLGLSGDVKTALYALLLSVLVVAVLPES